MRRLTEGSHEKIYHGHRQPDPEDLGNEDVEARTAEEPRNAHGRGIDRPPGHVIARIVERDEETHAHSLVGHGVEEPVGRGNGKEKSGQAPPLSGEAGRVPVRELNDEDAHDQRKREGMKETAMTEHAAVLDAEVITDNIDVRNYRADAREDPEFYGHLFGGIGLAQGFAYEYVCEC